ncbi:MAG TPA: MFS transporter [Casimicrobiaceae bacterium]|nr:MFS transporter [Casimicrobiaceae bacterium]
MDVDSHEPIVKSRATARSPVARLFLASGLRAFADGYVSLLLPLYLLELGLGAFDVGLVTTTTLLGSGVVTLLVGVRAHRYRTSTLLVAAAMLMMCTGLSIAFVTTLWPLLLIAFVGTLNPSSGDVSVFVPLEHALLSHVVNDEHRTATFARYSLTRALAAACGALAAALPSLVTRIADVSMHEALQGMFVLYALIALVAARVYAGLPAPPARVERRPVALSAKSRRNVYALAALFSLDAFGGGFIVQSMLALWLFERFSLSVAMAGTLFFWTGVFTAFSYLVAARIAKRIGLVNTMVFTHLPSSLCLLAIPFVPSLAGVVTLLLIRSALSQMDVPTRSSYVMAIVAPHERPAAASVTSVPRSWAAAISPLVAGYLLGVSSFAWPLLIGGGVKILYDGLLLLMFRHVRPPEETPIER